MKHPIDTSQWGEFVVGELFDCDTTKTFYPNKSELPSGNTPYITRSTYDNGVSGYYDDINNEFTIEGNCLTIGAEGGIAFWQPQSFIAGVKVYTIRHPKLNELTALFIASLLNTNSTSYSYSNARVLAKIKAEVIKLPLKPSADPENYTQDDIDWNYMDTVMSRVTEKAKERLASLPAPEQRSKTPVDTSTWGEFVVGELFNMIQGRRLKKADFVEGEIPYVMASSYNNGVITHISNPITTGQDLLTADIFGNVFYQSSFIGFGDDNCGLKLKNYKANKYQYLFLATVFSKFQNEASFTNKLRGTWYVKQTIKLPLKPSADPENYTQEDIDWDYMDSFMQAIEEKAHTRLVNLTHK